MSARDPDRSPSGQAYPVPLELESGLELCGVCKEPVREHWRGRACLPARQPVVFSGCPRCGAPTLTEVGAGYACLTCLMVGIHEEL